MHISPRTSHFLTSVTASKTLSNISLLAAITPFESNVLPFPKFNGAPVTSPLTTTFVYQNITSGMVPDFLTVCIAYWQSEIYVCLSTCQNTVFDLRVKIDSLLSNSCQVKANLALISAWVE